jgi:quercetin dioxygenase-like cupin family protein
LNGETVRTNSHNYLLILRLQYRKYLESLMKKFIKSSWVETDKQLLDPKLTQRVFSTENALIVHYVYEPGLEFEEHSHPQEQITIILSGHLILEIEGEKVDLKSGDICSVAPNVAHSTTVLGEDKVESISIFTPGTGQVVIQK